MDEYLAFPAALAGAALLALTGLGCLLFYRGKNRRYLAWTAGVFTAALLLLLGGEALLGLFGLTWRNLPAGLLCAAVFLSGAAGIFLILGCVLPLEPPETAPALLWIGKGLLTACAGLVLWYGLCFGPLLAAFAFGGEERVLEYGGQTLVEVDDSFLDPIYNYYEYHGPLVRGSERIYSRLPARIDGDRT